MVVYHYLYGIGAGDKSGKLLRPCRLVEVKAYNQSAPPDDGLCRFLVPCEIRYLFVRIQKVHAFRSV